MEEMKGKPWGSYVDNQGLEAETLWNEVNEAPTKGRQQESVAEVVELVKSAQESSAALEGLMKKLNASPSVSLNLNNDLREAQIIADLDDILKIYQKPRGVFLCVNPQIPEDAKVIRADMNVLSNELHVVLGTTSQGLFWRRSKASEPDAIPFRPAGSIQNVEEISDEILKELILKTPIGKNIIDFCNRVIALYQADIEEVQTTNDFVQDTT